MARLFPTNFNIGGVEYKVLEPEMCEKVSNFGNSCNIDGIINIARKVVEATDRKVTDVSEDIRNETFFHELVHVIINASLGYNDFDENQVQQTAVLLHQFIKDNYKLKDEKESTQDKA